VTIVTLSRNSGIPRALNVGFALARGRKLTWTSSDNEMLPQCLATLSSYLDDHPQIGLVYASHHNVGLRTAPTRKPPFNIDVLRRGKNVIGPCFMYRREIAELVGPYDPECLGAEDYDVWLRMSEVTQIASIPDLLYTYRHHAHSMSARCPELVERSRRKAMAKAAERASRA